MLISKPIHEIINFKILLTMSAKDIILRIKYAKDMQYLIKKMISKYEYSIPCL